MTDLKTAILDARYIDMIGLADFVVRDCGLPDMDAEGNFLPQANEIAAAIFRWAAEVDALNASQLVAKASAGGAGADGALDEDDDGADADGADLGEYDEHGDPVMDVEEAERREAARDAEKEESA